MAFKLRSYEDQARLSVIMAVLGCLAALAVLGLLAWKFDRSTFFVPYNARGPFLSLVGVGLVGGVLVAGIGFFVALNSAGQRRNTLSAVAWKAFFANALVLTVLISSAIFLYFTRYPITIPK